MLESGLFDVARLWQSRQPLRANAPGNIFYLYARSAEVWPLYGWLDARRETCLEGGPRQVAIYTITGPEAYETPEFHAIKGFGPFADKVRNFHRIRLTRS